MKVRVKRRELINLLIKKSNDYRLDSFKQQKYYEAAADLEYNIPDQFFIIEATPFNNPKCGYFPNRGVIDD